MVIVQKITRASAYFDTVSPNLIGICRADLAFKNGARRAIVDDFKFFRTSNSLHFDLRQTGFDFDESISEILKVCDDGIGIQFLGIGGSGPDGESGCDRYWVFQGFNLLHVRGRGVRAGSTDMSCYAPGKHWPEV